MNFEIDEFEHIKDHRDLLDYIKAQRNGKPGKGFFF
jgi:hypothetical protein